MLPSKNRLNKTKDIERVFKKGETHREGFLFLKLAENGLTLSRFAFVVGQKVSKKAVLRNKIKRRMREAVKKQLPNIKPGFDGVWVALKGLENENLVETEAAIKEALRKAEVCR